MSKKPKKETFLLVSLKEEKAKQLAQVISNPSCRKILDYLTTVDDATETKISKDLKIPISTVHYNLTHLQKGGLVEVEEFHYSQKGKEVNHYKLANKFIIISPKSTKSIREKLTKRLGSILPIALISIVIGGAIQFFNQTKLHTFQIASRTAEIVTKTPVMDQDFASAAGAAGIPETATTIVEETAKASSQAVSDTAFDTIAKSIIQYPGYWFIAGVITFIILYLIWSLIKKE